MMRRIVFAAVAASAFVLTQAPPPAFAAGRHATGMAPENPVTYRSFPVTPRFRDFLPPEYDISAQFPPVGDQGVQPSCVGWAVGYAMRSYYEHLRQNWSYTENHLFSPAYIYNQLTGASDCSQGIQISRALDLVEQRGVASLTAFPYDPHTCTTRPASDVNSAAQAYRIDNWRTVNTQTMDDIKGQVKAGRPVVIGFNINDAFEDLSAGQIYDSPATPTTGSHAMVIVAYSDVKQAVKVMNSWGRDWGDSGYGWISYRTLSAKTASAFVATLDIPPPAPPPAPVVVVTPPPAPAPTPPAPVVVVTPPPAPAPQPPAPAPKPVVVVPPPTPPAPAPAPAPQPVKPVTLPQAVSQIIKGYECAKLGTVTSGNTLTGVRGFVGSDADRAKLQQQLQALPGGGALKLEIASRPWPQCEALLTLDAALANGRGLQVSVAGSAGPSATPVIMTGGSPLVIQLTTPDFPSYLYVAYVQADGSVLHLYRADPLSKALAPNTKVTLGQGAGQASYKIGAPFGNEMIVAVASASPLFASEPPDSQIEREYLTEIRIAYLAKSAGGKTGGRQIAAAIQTMKTQGKN